MLICLFALVAMFGGGLIGLYAARALPQHHLTKESGAVVKLSAAIVASLTSLCWPSCCRRPTGPTRSTPAS